MVARCGETGLASVSVVWQPLLETRLITTVGFLAMKSLGGRERERERDHDGSASPVSQSNAA